MTGGGHGGPAVQPCLFLLFADDARPSAADVRTALQHSGVGLVSHDPAEREAVVVASDWLEVLVDGLTFDLLGLSPGRGLAVPAPDHCFGLTAAAVTGAGGIGIAPGPHLASAANAMPVVRTLLRLAAALSSRWEGAIGALWQPAGSLMGRDLFTHLIGYWLTGGAFPALGLTAVAERANGVLASDGLNFFTGQELVLDADLSADRPAATRLLTRLIDHLAEGPPLHAERRIELERGGHIWLRPRGATIDVTAD